MSRPWPRCLAFDPGVRTSGYALSTDPDRAPVILGEVESSPPEIKRLLRELEPTLIAVEAVGNYLAGTARAAPVFATARVAGMLEALAHPVRVLTLPANAPRGRPSWRALLTGVETAGDADVRRALELRLGPLPASSVHARDALGLAVVALCLSRAGASG